MNSTEEIQLHRNLGSTVSSIYSDPNTNKTWRKGFKPGGDSMRLSHMQKLISAVDNALNEEGATKNQERCPG
jgi:hypothetical protein